MFISRLHKVKRSEHESIWGLCLAEIKHLKTAPWYRHGAREPSYGYSTTTLRSVLTRYRNAVRTHLGKTHPALHYLKPSHADQDTVKVAYTESIVEQHTNLRPIDPDDLVARALNVLRNADSSNPFALAAALIAVTGRRAYEIGCIGTLAKRRRGRISKLLTPATGNTLVFSGQAKTRGADTAQTTPYEIPVLADPGLVLRAFERLRKAYSLEADIGYIAFNRGAGKRISEYSRRLFADASPFRKPLNAKDLRAAYATIAFSWYAPKDVSLNVYVARILGHSHLDVKTSISYIDFYPIGHKHEFVTDYNRAARDAVTELHAEAIREHDAHRRAQLEERIAILRSTI